jgi:hypothetical protein
MTDLKALRHRFCTESLTGPLIQDLVAGGFDFSRFNACHVQWVLQRNPDPDALSGMMGAGLPLGLLTQHQTGILHRWLPPFDDAQLAQRGLLCMKALLDGGFSTLQTPWSMLFFSLRKTELNYPDNPQCLRDTYRFFEALGWSPMGSMDPALDPPQSLFVFLLKESRHKGPWSNANLFNDQLWFSANTKLLVHLAEAMPELLTAQTGQGQAWEPVHAHLEEVLMKNPDFHTLTTHIPELQVLSAMVGKLALENRIADIIPESASPLMPSPARSRL